MQILAILLYAIWIFISTAFRVLYPFLILAFLFTVGRMIYRHYKYGYDYFSFLKKREVIDAKREVLLRMLEKQEFESIVLEDKQYHSSLIAMTEIGILLFQIFPFTGVHVEGNKEVGEFTYWEAKNKKKRLHNPFLFQKEDMEKIRTLLPDVPLFSFVVFDNLSILLLSGDSESEVLYVQDYYYKLEKLGKNKKQLYQMEDMKKMHQVLKG